MEKPKRRRAEVFLNIAYDKKFARLFLGYIAGISAYGMVSRAMLEISDSRRRLEKILKLERSCQFSVHDLSRVELDRTKPRAPRFNMPFELGLCVADANRRKGQKQNWFVFEAVANRINKSLSDLGGTDPRIHGGTVRGVMSGICEIFKRPGRPPTVPQTMRVYRALRKGQPAILRRAGSKRQFTKRVFRPGVRRDFASADDCD